MGTLTPSQEHYIKTIHNLSPGNQGVHITEIADKLGVTKASVCTAMKTLQNDNIVFRGKKRLVFLTGKGKYQALGLTEKYDIIKCFLLEVLKVDKDTASQDACAMEHVLSSETLREMTSMIEHFL